MPEPASATIERIGTEGDGIGRLPDGAPVYVPFTVPGETVLAEPIRPRGDGWLARAVRIIRPSPSRIEPPCPAFGRCGGCALQHWAEADYAGWKQSLLAVALRRAGFADLPSIGFVSCCPGERRRMDFAVRRMRGGITMGLHAAGSAEVVDISECLVLHPDLQALLPLLRQMLPSLTAVRREASIVVNLLDSGPDILLRTDAALPLADRTQLTDFARRLGVPRVSWALSDGEAEAVCQFLAPVMTFNGVAVRLPPGAFLQATAAGQAAIAAAVLDRLPGRCSGRRGVAELFAGCGAITFALAPKVRVSAFEGDGAAVRALTEAANRSGLAGRVTAERRDLTRQPLSAKELSSFAAVVLDPPHAGAASQVSQIAASHVPVVIYVSCNQATLSRDARLLHDAGYRLTAATAIDQFLWSVRLEAVCVFSRTGLTS